MTLALLFESAVRSMALGVCIWISLKLVRLRDSRTETLLWTVVLLAGLFMPLLERMLPSGIALPVPSLSAVSRPAASLKALPNSYIAARPAALPMFPLNYKARDVVTIPIALDGNFSTSMATPQFLTLGWKILQPRVPALVLTTYWLFAAVSLGRLVTGLILTARLYATAVPIGADWAVGRQIRSSASVFGPISFGRYILLPVDYAEWTQSKLLAVLAHEESHVMRGDFFIQLLAAVHCSLFWFSPFAWWLKARLCELGETASDEAAIRRLNDRTQYAEILIEVSRQACGIPAVVAMAKGPDIHWRVNRILDGKQERTLSIHASLLAVSAILPATCLVASAHAATLPTLKVVTRPLVAQTAVPKINMAAALRVPAHIAKPSAAAHPRAVTMTRHTKKTSTADITTGDSDIAYNPRALLEDADMVIVPAVVPTESHTKGKNKVAPDSAIILNLNDFANTGD